MLNKLSGLRLDYYKSDKTYSVNTVQQTSFLQHVLTFNLPNEQMLDTW